MSTRRRAEAASLPCFAATAPGLESVTAGELRALKLTPFRIEPGGVAFGGSLDALWRANLHLRTASRVLLRLATFRATAFYELEKHARGLPWDRFLHPGDALRLRATCHKSRLYHSGAVIERLFDAARRAVPGLTLAVPGDDDVDASDETPHPLFLARFLHDVCVVSVDSSGALLHRRGYRQATSEAPLRETLAAALLLAAGYTGDAPLADPFCGSGTIPIEAAWIARRIAPGLNRRFAFERWEDFDETLYQGLRDTAKREALPRVPAPILGSDLSRAALEAAHENAERAGVLDDLRLAEASFEHAPLPSGHALVATNPPYGVRLGDATGARATLRELGRTLKARAPDATLALLAPFDIAQAIGFPVSPKLSTRNGGLSVSALVGRVTPRPACSSESPRSPTASR